MNATMRTGRWCGLLLFSLMSCNSILPDTDGVESSSLERDPTFLSEQLVRDGVAIAAVVSSEPERLAAEASAEGLASDLRVRILEDRPSMRVLFPGHVERALGPTRYTELANTVAATGELEPARLAEVRQNLKDPVRYLLIGRLEKDRVSTDRDPKLYSTQRETTMRFSVYDLQTTSRVFSGRFTSSRFTTCPGPDAEEDDVFEPDDHDSLLELIGKEVANEMLEDHDEVPPPDPVSIQEQTQALFDEFLAALFDPET